jgi:hypothetical protein
MSRQTKRQDRFLSALFQLWKEHNGHNVWESTLAERLGYKDDSSEEFSIVAREAEMHGLVARYPSLRDGELHDQINLTREGKARAEYLALPAYKKLYRVLKEFINRLSSIVH